MIWLVVIILIIVYSCAGVCDDTPYPAHTGGSQISKPTHFVVFPMQLFANTEALDYPNIVIIEHPVVFTKYRFHKLALVHRRASCRSYAEYLRKKSPDANIKYIEFNDASDWLANAPLFAMYDIVDVGIEKTLPKGTVVLPTPYFLNTKADIAEYVNGGNAFRHDASFYPWMRSKYNVLITKTGKPLGGKWSYDKENRNPFPLSIEEPKISKYRNSHIDEARKYVDLYFSDNYGDYSEMMYPCDRKQAMARLRDFINHKLPQFGKYQDAAAKSITFGYHSVLSSSLNCGLLTPREVIDAVVTAYYERKAPLASVEGFIRQILGWREYCHLMYRCRGEEMRKSNYFNHSRKLTATWWEGKTGLTPIDDICKRINKSAYAHHIERLMWLSAVMLMCGVAPDAVYEWFISFIAIDAYDWVMTPNIYGMGTYADGGSNNSMMTRPYFSSFAYVEKMSDWDDPKDAKIWNALYYNFIGVNKAKLKSNYYTARWIGNYERKSASERKEIKETASKFIAANTIG